MGTGTSAAGSGVQSAVAPASYGSLLLTSLVVLAVVIAVAALLVWLSRRTGLAGRTPAPGLLEVVARVPLEPRRALYIVDVAGKALLVGTSEMGLTLLTELDRDVVRARDVPRRGFADLVRDAVARRRASGTEVPPSEIAETPAQAAERGAHE